MYIYEEQAKIRTIGQLKKFIANMPEDIPVRKLQLEDVVEIGGPPEPEKVNYYI